MTRWLKIKEAANLGSERETQNEMGLSSVLVYLAEWWLPPLLSWVYLRRYLEGIKDRGMSSMGLALVPSGVRVFGDRVAHPVV